MSRVFFAQSSSTRLGCQMPKSPLSSIVGLYLLSKRTDKCMLVKTIRSMFSPLPVPHLSSRIAFIASIQDSLLSLLSHPSTIFTVRKFSFCLFTLLKSLSVHNISGLHDGAFQLLSSIPLVILSISQCHSFTFQGLFTSMYKSPLSLNLRSLSLSKCCIRYSNETSPLIPTLLTLEELFISQCPKFTSKELGTLLFNSTSLETLSIPNLDLCSSFPLSSIVSRCPRISELDIHDCLFSKPDFLYLLDPLRLLSLNLVDCLSISETQVGTLRQFRKLQHLFLGTTSNVALSSSHLENLLSNLIPSTLSSKNWGRSLRSLHVFGLDFINDSHLANCTRFWSSIVFNCPRLNQIQLKLCRNSVSSHVVALFLIGLFDLRILEIQSYTAIDCFWESDSFHTAIAQLETLSGRPLLSLFQFFEKGLFTGFDSLIDHPLVAQNLQVNDISVI